MSQDGAPDPREQGSAEEPTQPTEWALPQDGQSRRRFLRTALIGSAAAAAVVGGGAVVAASPLGPRILRKITPAVEQHSPPDGSTLCIEETTLPGTPLACFDINSQGMSSPGAFWLIFTILSVAPGTYYAEIMQSTDGGVTEIDITSSSSPFEVDKNPYRLAVGGPFVTPCPKSVGADASANADDDPAVTVTIPAGPNQDVQFAMKLKWNGGIPSPETITFIGRLTDTGESTVFAQATTSIVTPCND